ncbi:MAG: transporter [Alphaproteobacteria bacterium]|nr:MAG: transporter [Alphaproteobacteria bacterium]
MRKYIKPLKPVFAIRLLSGLTILFLGILPVQATEQLQESSIIIGMDMAIKAAKLKDPWLVGNKHSQDSIESLSIAAGSLPDPNMSLGMTNLAADSFNFGQEAMTNAKVGISQMFPAGDSLAIRQRQLELKGSQFPFQREDRRAKVTVTVGQLWLNAYNAQESIKIIDKNIPLFEQLVDIAEASYSTALGKTRQQDIIRAQLELTRLDDRLTILRQRQEMFQEQLSEWLNGYFLDKYLENQKSENREHTSGFLLARKLPDIKLLNPELYASPNPTSQAVLFEKISGHPALRVIEQKIRTSKAGIDLAKQQYKPKWGINAGYGFRSRDRQGIDRPDLFSVGVTFSVPLFTANRQDKQVLSAMSKTSAVKTEKWQILRKFMAAFETTKAQLLRLNERQKIFQSRLLPQMSEQAEASLTAYTNDDGDFAEVMRARIAQMNAEVDALNIEVGRQKAILQLNYLFMTNSDQIIE